MNTSAVLVEKKVNDHYDDTTETTTMNSRRIDRLEQLVNILYTDLHQAKEQQKKSFHQVLGLQADLVAAESARQEAETQLQQQQLRDHELLLSLIAATKHHKPQQQHYSIEYKQIKPEVMIEDVIDVTSFTEGTDDYDSSYCVEEIVNVDELHAAPTSIQDVIQLWEELSTAMQHLSSDQLDHRDALEFNITKIQLQQNQQITQIEKECTTHFEAIKDMATEWDEQFNELHDHLSTMNKQITTNLTDISNNDSKLNDLEQRLQERVKLLENMVQRHVDYHRQCNGERLINKRENEKHIQKLYHSIQHLTALVQDQFELITKLQSNPTCTHCHQNNTFTEENITLQPEESDSINNSNETPINDNNTNCKSTWLPAEGSSVDPKIYPSRSWSGDKISPWCDHINRCQSF